MDGAVPVTGSGDVVSKRDISRVVVGTPRNELCSVPWGIYKNLVALNPSTIAEGIPPDGSMLKLKCAWDTPRKDTDDFLWGRVVHCLLFEPGEFDKRYTQWSGRRAGNDYKEFASECWERGKEILTEKQVQTSIAAASRFVHDKLVRELISAGKAEVTLFCGENDVQCRGRVDWISSSCHRLVDLKTTKNVAPRLFSRDFYKYHYDVKLGLYRRWLQKLTNETWPVSVVTIEKTPPYDIVVYPIPDAVLDRGMDKGMVAIWRVRKCIETGEWPGIADGKEGVLDTPTWEMDEEELTGAEVVEDETAA